MLLSRNHLRVSCLLGRLIMVRGLPKVLGLVGKKSFFCRVLVLLSMSTAAYEERWGAGVENQKNVREEIGGWGRVPFNEPYAPSLSTIYDGA